MRRILLLICILLATSIATSVEARADDAGSRYRGMAVDGVEIEGLERSLASALRKGLALTGKRGFLGLQGIRYEPGMLPEDLERTRLFLARHGYPYATVSGSLTPDEKGRKVKARLLVDTGPAIRIRSLEFVNMGEAQPITRDNQRKLGIAVGEIFTDVSAERARQAVLEYLRERGYARATLEIEIVPIDSTGVGVRMTGDRGRRWRFGEVRVEGVPEEFHAVVNRAANIPAGELYNPRTVRDATDDIRGLRLFRRVEIQLVPADSTTLDFAATLSERDHRSLEFGVGYLSDDGPIATAGWEHRNLFHAGRGFRVFASVSEYEQLIESSVTFPAMFRSSTTGIGSVAYERQVEPAYDASDLRTTFLFVNRFNRRVRITAGPQLQIINVLETGADPDVPSEIADAEGPVSSLIFEWNYDNSNDPLFPTRGVRFLWENQLAPAHLGSISEFYRLGVGAAGYQRVGHSTILAARVYSGVGWPLWGSEDLLINYRYFAGGSNSHRGYQRERLGPKDADNNPQGGQLSLLGAVELRFPFWKYLEGSLFVDGGQVWSHHADLSVADLSYAWGPGLAIKSPIGPIRFDYGIRIGPPDDGEPNGVFHFAIGYAF